MHIHGAAEGHCGERRTSLTAADSDRAGGREMVLGRLVRAGLTGRGTAMGTQKEAEACDLSVCVCVRMNEERVYESM